ncbi:50S ribosomal protein L24 [Buchnera aphidicola (Pterocallis alni)]|uniref:50S ribosomal protein L24 n=1 Tax=Buchnera aphidicola TaxID=9 RepID=UPI0034649BDF
MAVKIRSNDHVIILSGKDKGKIGIVQTICLNKNKVVVKGMNLVKKHQKGIPSKNISSTILQKEAWIHISNVAIFNPITKKADRVGFRFESGKKVRYFKSNNHIIN